SDLRWLQALTHGAGRRSSASWYRNHGVDERFLESSKDAIGRTLEGGRFLTRGELREALGADGLDVSGQRLTIVLFDAELDSLICSGPLAGKHHTYALVDERVPPAAPLSDDEATALLIRRYLYGHGPATLKDLRWWCNLTLKRIRSAVETLGDGVIRETIDGVEYLRLPGHDPFAEDGPQARRGRRRVEAPRFQMLGVFDELFTGYSESRGLIDPDGEFGSVLPLAYGPLPNLLLEGDRLVGQWRADRRGRRVSVSIRA